MPTTSDSAGLGQGREAERPRTSRAAAAARQAPAWVVSTLVHVIALLALALVVSRPPPKETPRVIEASRPDVEEEFTELADDPPDEPDADVPDAVEVAVVPDIAAAAVDVAAEDLAAAGDPAEEARLAVEFTDVGIDAAESTMMDRLGSEAAAGGLGGRADAARLAAARGGGGDTEQAVARGLAWIASHQLADGGWSFDMRECPGCGGRCSGSGGSRARDRTGATAMALLPFLGRGYTHRAGPHRRAVEQGIAFLAQRALAGGGRAYDDHGNLYSQGLAGIALSECYAMTQDNRLAAPTRAVLNFIMEAQDPVGGGWRYWPRQPGDTSAVGWQIMALKSGNMASLPVNPLTIRRATAFLDSVESRDGARYGYTDSSNPQAGRTAVGLLCRMYLGWKKDHPALREGVEYLSRTGPRNDLYYDYYATQVMHHVEGDEWVEWNRRMKEMLLGAQATAAHEAGSWFEGFDRGHAPEAAGRLYCTSLATMILEVYYRHLPIYRAEVVDGEFRE